ncbi:hypothetical protein C7N43_35605 [Sphingobacteriales bacterium UPWRP_1]|nr:hypothetical protein B6N25_06450 [Sphingobacteriales bacterium TSM_CSS]PSJ72167.1 hypothetical protein C7N43_35605 [Sphingobacteriales bacterium UPWRP_1]
MIKTYIYRIVFVVALAIYMPNVQTYAQCPTGQSQVMIVIDPDTYAASETDWYLRDLSGTLLASGSTAGTTLCLPNTTCLTFTITDTYGDGLYTASNPGSYEVYYNGVLIDSGVNFGYQASVQFGGCPPGISCTFPQTIPVGSYTAPQPNTWYLFQPTATGEYGITTCTASCNTAIWVYDYCEGLDWDDTQEGAIGYETDGCPNGTGQNAIIYLNLQAGNTYYIRIGDDGTSCEGIPISWSVLYIGPISGCMDPTACNFEPMATVHVPSECLYSPNPDCPDGPDLIVVQSEIISSMYTQNKSNTDNCYVNEGCMAGYGTRRILRFTTHIKNIGNQDYYIGSPPASQTAEDPQWEWDNCHQHWHYEGYAEYVLYDVNGAELPVGFKNGFCVLDLECSGGGTAKFSCGNQGITAGCGDIYNHSLNCQWIDITTVPSGIYTLVVRVNWDHSPDKLGRHELNYSNNWAQACIQITQGATSASVSVVSGCSPYTDCLGEIYGAAQPDCSGICAGPFKVGDTNLNYQYDNLDPEGYLTGLLDGTLTYGSCKDANEDDMLSITDAILVNACVRELAELPHPGAEWRDFCDLSTFNIVNTNDTAWFSLGAANAAEQYVDIYLKNPLTHILGYQLQMSGAVFSNAENLVPDAGYTIDVRHNPAGLIIGFSPDESIIPRYLVPTPVLRVFYSQITDTEICLESVMTAVNNNYEEVVGIVTDNCRTPYHTIQVKLFLQGAYNPVSDVMRTDLSANGWLPAAQPFNTPPWNYNGTETVGTPANITPDITDWVLVELRYAASPTVVAEKRAAFVRNDGYLIDVYGNPGLNITQADPNQNYMLVVRARNHMAIVSNVIFTPANQPLIDLTQAANVFLNNWTMAEIDTDNSGQPVFGLLGGDFNADGIISVTDFNQFIIQPSQINGYYFADASLDGQVAVQDFNLFAANAGRIGMSMIRY